MLNKKMTRQQVFERVWNHYIAEGHPYAINKDKFGPTAVYRTKDGHKSPAGVLISDKEYDETMEEKGLKTLYNKVKNMYALHVDYEFFLKLDDVHYSTVDQIFQGVNLNKVHNFYARRFLRDFRKNMKYRLIAFAVNHGLTIPSELPRTVHAKKVAHRYKK